MITVSDTLMRLKRKVVMNMSRKKGSTRAPTTFKDNFWSKLRVEKGLTVKEIREYLCSQGLRVCNSSVGMFFTGQVLPPDAVVEALCSLFDIDKSTGDLEFQHAHRDWKAEENPALVCSARKTYPKTKCEVVKAPVVDTSIAHVTIPAVQPSTTTFTLDEVTKMFEARKQFALSALYGQVDQQTYEKVRALFEVNL